MDSLSLFYHNFASKGKYKLSTKVPPFLRPIKIQLERWKVFIKSISSVLNKKKIKYLGQSAGNLYEGIELRKKK